MDQIESGIQARRTRRFDRALQILNMEPTEELLIAQIERTTGEPQLARLGPALFARREEIGGFRGADDLDGIEGLSDDVRDSLVDGLNLPPYVFESETLASIVWTHGSSLQVETPEAFGPMQRRRDGLCVYGLQFAQGTSLADLPVAEPRSWIHAPITVPSFSPSGSRFYVRSVLLNFRSSPAATDIYGRPFAAFDGLEVRDGHERVAVVDGIDYSRKKSFPYLRVPVESSQSLRWGLAVSLDLFLMWAPQGSTGWSITISSVGVELVTRTGLVVRQPALG